MDDESPRPPVAKKRAYRKPALRVYGQVRALTGAAGGTMNGDGGQKMFGSDRRMKRNIVRVGHHPRGFGLYLFDYDLERQARWGQERQFGVMADEVELVVPAAVSMGGDGYKQVDYAMLGISRPPRGAD